MEYQGAVVTALDYSEVSVDKARIYNKDAVSKGKMFVVRGNVSDLKIPAEKYDLATAFETICFWASVQGIMEEMAMDKDMKAPDPEWLISILRK